MNLLLTGAFKYNKEQLNKIEAMGYRITFIQDERKMLELDCSEFDAVVCNALFLYTPIEKFSSLKFIQATSAGLDRMPLEYIAKNKICLKNAKGVYSVPMAEWCICKILDIYKQSLFFMKNKDNGVWEKHRGLIELSGKTAVIIGAGDIGTQIAKRLSAFDVKVLAVDIFEPESLYFNKYYNISELNSVLSLSDIVIITLPLTDDTRNLFDLKILQRMKEGSIIINISRGGIINENALADVLENGKLMAAALDVFENEPLPLESRLWNVKNLLLSPHNSFVSENNSERLFKVIYNNLKNLIS